MNIRITRNQRGWYTATPGGTLRPVQEAHTPEISGDVLVPVTPGIGTVLVKAIPLLSGEVLYKWMTTSNESGLITKDRFCLADLVKYCEEQKIDAASVIEDHPTYEKVAKGKIARYAGVYSRPGPPEPVKAVTPSEAREMMKKFQEAHPDLITTFKGADIGRIPTDQEDPDAAFNELFSEIGKGELESLRPEDDKPVTRVEMRKNAANLASRLLHRRKERTRA